MTIDTYNPVPRPAQPTKLVQIENAIRLKLEQGLNPKQFWSDEEMKDLIRSLRKSIMDELLDLHLIGLPNSDIRTSVDADLVAKLGAKCNCRKGDDADDVVRTALGVIG
jgi:hypothetical protein